MLEVGRGYNPEIMEDSEEVDVEEIIGGVEEKCADFINAETEDGFNEIFDAARKSYSDLEVQKDWDQLFEDLESALAAAADEDEIASTLQSYQKKAKALA